MVLMPGPYRHYKGGRYTVIGVAETHEHDGKFDVVYVSLTTATLVTRPLARDSRKQDSWLDDVMWPDGKMRGRFMPETSISPQELVACGFGALGR
jgi:hypothetical protein